MLSLLDRTFGIPPLRGIIASQVFGYYLPCPEIVFQYAKIGGLLVSGYLEQWIRRFSQPYNGRRTSREIISEKLNGAEVLLRVHF